MGQEPTPGITATDALYERVKTVVPAIEWPVFASDIAAINALKRERNAVILAHNYMTPEIFHCVADFVGNSLQLAREAAKTDAAIIVQAGVHFMAETAKILSPEKIVLIPDTQAGCSLAESIKPADVALLRQKYPGLPIVTYVNTSAAIKAMSDICCTSANAVEVVEAVAADYGVDTVIMIPDEFLAQNVAKLTKVKIIAWKGHCEVHERFTAADIRAYRAATPGLVVLAHPECPPEVIAEADFAGSTSGMISYVAEKRPHRVVLVTECSMSDNVAAEYPDVGFVRPCNLCPHMKRITLPKILHSLETLTTEVTVEPGIAANARRAVDAMLKVKSGAAPHPARGMTLMAQTGRGALALAFTNPPPVFLIEPSVLKTLEEDFGRAGDITTDAIVPPEQMARAAIVAREAGVVSGLVAAQLAFTRVDARVTLNAAAPDGSNVAAGETIAHVEGPARALLGAERVALNFLGHLSGVATATHRLVEMTAGTSARIICTRKTLPGLRILEKYAVRCGGGLNHRFGLDDAVLVKDNHIAAVGGIAAVVKNLRGRLGPMVKIEIEVDSLAQLEEALAFGVDAILLDNMTPETMIRAVAMAQGRATLEASGGVTLERVRRIAETGVDYISSGAITHSARCLDLGLDFL